MSDKQIATIKNNFPKEIGDKLKFLRKERGYTQTELANATGKDRQYIYKIEKGKVTPNISTLYIILLALEISFQKFFKELETKKQ